MRFRPAGAQVCTVIIKVVEISLNLHRPMCGRTTKFPSLKYKNVYLQ